MRADVLTLTATPIPRCLNMAMSGMRDLSIIATALARRLAVKTFVREYAAGGARGDPARIAARRPGFYLYNGVENIEKAAQRWRNWCQAHRHRPRPMRERDLERVNDFHHQRFNVLGVPPSSRPASISPAPTPSSSRRRSFGFGAAAQAARPRRARSHHRAYAYLLTPNPKAMGTDAHKRLEAIASLEDPAPVSRWRPTISDPRRR